ncbi:MAG: hypothetical protein PVJ05_03865 [Candidatus Thorarchaeota archaeon]
MKKCHSCGAVLEDNEKTLREFAGEYYCVDCVDIDGNPENANPVRRSILSFWRAREPPEQDSRTNGS